MLAAVRLAPAAYFGFVTLLFAWPLLLGRSASVVPGFQALIWPWRGVVDTDRTLALQVDAAASSYPWSVTYHHALRRLEMPLWDWHSFTGGYDLASDGVAGVMYPVHWVLWTLFEPGKAHDFYVVLHLWAGGLLMFFLLRHWRFGAGPALVGGTAWMLAPFNVGWMQAEMLTPLLVVVPLTFWAVSAAIAQRTWGRVFGASAAIALALVAGNIIVFIMTVWVVGLWAAATWLCALARREPAAALRERAVTLLYIAVGGFALSAYSVVPTILNLLSLGRRPSRLEEVLPPPGDATGIALTLWNQPAIDTPAALFMLGWCGRVVLVLAVLGLLHRGGKRLLGASLVIVFTLLPATPWLVHVAWYVLPPLRAVAGFGRLTFLASFGMALLAASGTAVLLHMVSRATARTRGRRRSTLVRGAAVALTSGLIIGELLPFAVAVNPQWSERNDAFYPITAAHQDLRGRPGQWPPLLLAITPDSPAQPDGVPYYSFWGATAHIGGRDSVGGYDSAVPRRAAALSRIMEGTAVQTAVQPFSTAYLPAFSVKWTRLDLAQRVGVTHVYTAPGIDLSQSAYAHSLPEARLTHRGADGDVWELARPMRGPRLVGRAIFVESFEEAFTQFAAEGHNARRTVVLESPGSSERESAAEPPTVGPTGRVVRARRGPNEAEVVVAAKRAAWLVMPIGFAPGWHAHIDGEPLAIRPADGAMSAVRVPPGKHTVAFSYRPEGFRLGLLLTSSALLAGLGLMIVALYRRRNSRSVSSSVSL